MFFLNQLACFSEETCESVLPPNASLYASLFNLRPDATTCECVWPGLKVGIENLSFFKLLCRFRKFI